MTLPPRVSEYDPFLADELKPVSAMTMEAAEQTFSFFKNSNLFRWSDANNDCEDRANAICILLDSWGYTNYKAWVFGGYFHKKEQGYLTNCWKYHVAAVVPVEFENGVIYYVIDPATAPSLLVVQDWALQNTESGISYHFIKDGRYYIYSSGCIKKDNWHKRDRRNLNWTMQGLAGINGVSAKGKAQLVFNKKAVRKTIKEFRQLIRNKPAFLVSPPL